MNLCEPKGVCVNKLEERLSGTIGEMSKLADGCIEKLQGTVGSVPETKGDQNAPTSCCSYERIEAKVSQLLGRFHVISELVSRL